MQHELLGWLDTALDRLPSRYLPLLEGLDGLLIYRHHDRLHQKPGHHERQPHQGLVARRRLRPERLAKKVKDHKQPHHRCDGEQDGGEQRQQREDADDGPRHRVVVFDRGQGMQR